MAKLLAIDAVIANVLTAVVLGLCYMALLQ
jgi:hypothetical protein